MSDQLRANSPYSAEKGQILLQQLAVLQKRCLRQVVADLQDAIAMLFGDARQPHPLTGPQADCGMLFA